MRVTLNVSLPVVITANSTTYGDGPGRTVWTARITLFGNPLNLRQCSGPTEAKAISAARAAVRKWAAEHRADV